MPLKNKQISNPLRGESVVLSFKQLGFLNFDDASVLIQYIPDREIITEQTFVDWFKQSQKGHEKSTPETVSGQMLNVFYNEVLPYYITMDIRIHHKTGLVQRVQTIKKQPNYTIPTELESLLKA